LSSPCPVLRLITLPYSTHTHVAKSETNSTDRKFRYKMYLAACFRAANPPSKLFNAVKIHT
jgi:hypothetical protein